MTEEEQPADLAELLEELDENNRLVVFRLLKKEVATEAFAYMSDEARTIWSTPSPMWSWSAPLRR